MEWEFVKLNWHLFAALVLVIVLLALEPLRARRGGVRPITADDLPRFMRDEKVVIVDVSEEKEFASSHIPKSRNVPLSRLNSDINTLKRYKSRPVVVVCRVGNRSPKAAGILKKHEFSNLRTLQGGIAAWMKENLPVET